MPQLNPQSGEILIGNRFGGVITPDNSAQLEALKAGLPPGTKLEVQAAIGPDGKQGLVIRGQFVPAELPPGVNPGDKLNVLVVSNSSQLVLKLIGAGPQDSINLQWNVATSVNAAQAKPELQTLLEMLLPNAKEALRSLKELTSALVTKLPEEFTLATSKTAQTLNRPAEAQTVTGSTVSQSVPEQAIQTDNKLPEILKILFGHPILKQALLTDRDLGSPAAILADRLAEALSANLREPLTQMNSVIQNRQRPQDTLLELRLVLALRRQFELAVERSSPDFAAQNPAVEAGPKQNGQAAQSQQAKQEIPEALKPALETLMLALEHSSSQALPRMLELLKAADPKHNPLLLLLRTLKILDSEVLNSLPNPPQELSALIKTLLKDLQLLRENKGGEREVRQQLGQALTKLNQHTHNILDRNVKQSLPQGMTELLKSLETMTGAREALTQMNPLMQALGQPQHFTAPLLLGGFFGPLSISLEAPQKSSGEQDEKSQKQEKDYIRLSLSFSMPALGMIRLDLAHRDEEVLIKLACASPDTAAFIQKRLPALETAIRALGYRKASLASRTQIPGEGSPDWHKALNRAAVIA